MDEVDAWDEVHRRAVADGAEEAFDRVTRLVTSLLGLPMAYVNLVDGDDVVLKSAHGIPGAGAGRDPIERALCGLALEDPDPAPVSVPDTTTDPRTRLLPAVTDQGVRCWAGHPVLRPDGSAVGTLCAMDRRPRSWSDHDREVLAVLAQAVAGEIGLRVAVETARVAQQRAEEGAREARRVARTAEHHARESAELADTLRESLLPARLPEPPGLDVAARYVAGGEHVLGDFYDLFPTPGGWGLIVGDVCGHGAAAARTTALARSTVRAMGHTDGDPASVLAALHGVLHVWFARPSFVTALYATLHDAGEGLTSVTLAGGGHPPALVRRTDGPVEVVDPGGRALGIGPEPRVAVVTTVLAPGDRLVVVTDGVTEARTPGGAQLEVEGLRDLLAATPGRGDAEATVRAVVDGARAHAGTAGLRDDAAVVVLRATPDGSARAPA